MAWRRSILAKTIFPPRSVNPVGQFKFCSAYFSGREAAKKCSNRSGTKLDPLPFALLSSVQVFDCGTNPRLLQKYHVAIDRYGRQASARSIKLALSGSSARVYT